MFNSSTFFGTDGTLTLSDAEDFAGFTDYFGEDGAVGRVTNISLYATTAIRPFHELGSRAAKELRAGNISIGGSVERAYLNGALLKLMLSQYAENEESAGFKIPTFNMKVIMDNLNPPGDDGNSILTVFGVIFDSWQFQFPEDDFVLEKLTFKGKRIAILDNAVPT